MHWEPALLGGRGGKQKSHFGENLEAVFAFIFPLLALPFPSFLPDFLLVPHPPPLLFFNRKIRYLDWIGLKKTPLECPCYISSWLLIAYVIHWAGWRLK